ncbi:MAG: IMP dehydrogenase [Arenicellales bacterium]|nr:IMP dehydrogenase [Arenicellales bacterium]MDP7489535.1 IMP dehydrogenase [Arenicellales bacterium]
MEDMDLALTFDDVLLVPAFSEVLPRNVSLKTLFSRNIALNIPLVSAAMDTVTESRAAICLAQAGGIGVVHRNLTPPAQAAEVSAVKKYESGVITDPICVTANTTVAEVVALTREHRISGVPVLDDDGKLVGIVTSRDLRFETHFDQPISSVMTGRERLVTAPEGAGRAEIRQLLHQYRIEKVLLVDGGFNLKGMVTVKDIQKQTEFPHASKDDRGRLRVAAAVGTGEDTSERIERLVDAGVDAVVVDTAHGHSRGVIEQIAAIKQDYAQIDVVAGNIATGDAALALADAGADAVKVGIGPGSICTTRIIAGVGVPQITAVQGVARALEQAGLPVIADGGIRYSGDIAKAIAAGAHVAMVGGLFAGTEEAPGEIELFQGRSYKSYRGMGSLGAMQEGSADRYFQESQDDPGKLVPEGIEGRVPYKGPMAQIIHQLTGGLRASMGYTGCANVEQMRSRCRFVQITHSGVAESHVHDVSVVKEAPNYQRGG